MFSWGMGVVLCLLLLLTGCGGTHQKLVNTNPTPPPEMEEASVDTDKDVAEEPLTEELSAKRLEELYAKSGIPGWDPGLEEEMKKWDHQVKFDVPIHTNRQVRAYLVYFSTERKGTIRRYLARSSRYLPMIKEVFQEYGLPEDLAFLAMIESGFNPNAYSHAHACGMWQFIRGTGARYGLLMDSYMDERRDPEKSTRAAAKYLLDLYKQFGSWYLAAASYNCGENRVQKELDKSTHKNFFELSANQCLPNETKNYVPQMIAATIIAKNPEKFGFKNVPYLPALATEKVQVKEAISLKAAAMAINVPVEEVRNLNPELLRGVTPPGMTAYNLKLPPKSKEAFAKNIMLASMEHPAVAAVSRVAKKSSGSRPNVARTNGSKSSSGRSYSKSSRKGKVRAKKSGSKDKVKVASSRKGKHGHQHQAKPAVHTASMLPVDSGGKSASKKQGKVAGKKGGTKVKGLARAKSSGKSSNDQVSRKTGKTSKTNGKSKSQVGSKSKGKSRSSKAMLMSKAR